MPCIAAFLFQDKKYDQQEMLITVLSVDVFSPCGLIWDTIRFSDKNITSVRWEKSLNKLNTFPEHSNFIGWNPLKRQT